MSPLASKRPFEHTRLEDLQILLLGAGGHASVLHDMLLALGYPPKGVIDATLEAGATWEGLPILGDDDLLATFSPEKLALVNGLGASPNCIPRNRLYERYRRRKQRHQYKGQYRSSLYYSFRSLHKPRGGALR